MNCESEVVCSFCNSKFKIAGGGRYDIEKHVKTQKHIESAKKVYTNQSMNSFVTGNPAADLLRAKELTFAFHSAKHQIWGRAVDCTSKLVGDMYELKFTCGRTKSSKLILNVSSSLLFPKVEL